MPSAAKLEIDLNKSDVAWWKGKKLNQLIYLILFLSIMSFSVIHDLTVDGKWTSYKIGLAAMAFSIIMYLQISGKWLYRHYIKINIYGIQWQEAKYNFERLKWAQIKEINVENSAIIFRLTKGTLKHFSLTEITVQQITDIKEILIFFSKEKGIKYI